MHQIAGDVAAATEEQRQATSEIMQSIARAAEHTRAVASSTQSLLAEAATTEATARDFSGLAQKVDDGVDDLNRRITVVLRSSSAGDRRRANTVLAIAPLAALWGPSPVTRASGRGLDVGRVLRITQGAPAVGAVALSCQGGLEALGGARGRRAPHRPGAGPAASATTPPRDGGMCGRGNPLGGKAQPGRPHAEGVRAARSSPGG